MNETLCCYSIQSLPPIPVTNVVSLLHFDGNLKDETGSVWEANSDISFHEGIFDGQSLLGEITNTTRPFGLDSCIEFWCYPLNTNFSFHLSPSSYSYPFCLEINNSWSTCFIHDHGYFWNQKSYFPKLTLNIWHHIAYTRKNNNAYLYIDGNQILSGSTRQAGNHRFPPKIKSINGYIDEVCMTKSTKYESNFTPPSAPFTIKEKI